MVRLDAIRIFVRVVETGTFSAVAREMGLGQPAISKQVAALESYLGAQLLMRTSRSLSLTEAGRDFYESAVQLMNDLEAAESRVGSRQSSPSGVIRITAAHAFSRLYVVPRLPEFRARFPKVTVEMLVSERTSNLVEEGIDLAIRNGNLEDSSLVARKLGESPIVAVASTEYLAHRGTPRRPDELENHDGVVFVSQDGPRAWRFGNRAEKVAYTPNAAFRTNDGEQLRSAVLVGLGITQAPLWLFAGDIAAGVVKRIMTTYEPGSTPLSAVRPASRRQPSKVVAFSDFLAEILTKDALG
jgi:LysR family transcriptional regulator for bpeEF and oprC